MKVYCHISSPMGVFTAVSEKGVLKMLSFNKIDFPDYRYNQSEPVLLNIADWLDCYFSGKNPKRDFPYEPDGTEFQKKVWRIVNKIPYGETMTYGEIANIIAFEQGGRMSAQAVGGAVGRNPIPIIIPCHRVMGAGSALTGFSDGLNKKIFLLELENISYKK